MLFPSESTISCMGYYNNIRRTLFREVASKQYFHSGCAFKSVSKFDQKTNLKVALEQCWVDKRLPQHRK